MFSLIVISHDTILPGEASIIQQLFDEGLTCFHLRKPGAAEWEIRQLLDAIPAAYRAGIALHGFHHLAGEYGMHRLHYTELHRQREDRVGPPPKGGSPSQILSTSVHDLQTLQRLPAHFSYTFFSPVFDSISKQEYKGVTGDDFYLADELKAVPVMALGGIDARNIEKVAAMNFDGAAVLGAIWNEPEKAIERWVAFQKRLASSR